MNCPQVKICGLTNSAQALECAELGADAIGMVFYEKSPRNISAIAAARIAQVINGLATPVAVTVDMPIDELLCMAMTTGISVFQLHGNESAEYVKRLRGAGLRVIKHISGISQELEAAAENYNDAYAFIVECGKGELPGGNGARWDWSQANVLAGKYPCVLAGGLSVDNVSDAVKDSQADAVDASSSLEQSPGVKDMKLVEEFIKRVKNTDLERQVKRIF
jgi:phosphoribosylanthranilate isomerase